MPVHACTIIARNYLPFARVLGTSFRQQHPDGVLTVLIFDDLLGEVEAADEPFDVVHIDDLGADALELYRMAAMYDITEFATALKPWLLQLILQRGAESVLYLDPDIQVLGSLERLAALAAERDIILTPHAVRPMPRDGKMTTETSILAAGIYNLGFIGVGRGTLDDDLGGEPRFLGFWKERLLRECVNDPQSMRFVDQRWVDFVPAVFPSVIVRDPTCNVAYWNLDHRALRFTGDGYEVNGEPITFFHFSGFDPTMGHLLSKHQGADPRILLSDHPDLRRICRSYGDQLLAHGFEQVSDHPYGFGTMANGVPMDRYVRRIYRDAVGAADRNEDVYPPIPWDLEGADALCEWMAARPRIADDPGNLPVYLATVFSAEIQALRPQFFDPQDADRERFLEWARHEAAAGRLVGRFVPDRRAADELVEQGNPDRRSVTGWAGPDALRPGFVVAGYLKAELGVGEGARLLLASMEAGGIPCTPYVLTQTSSRQEHAFAVDGPVLVDLDTVVLSVNADQVPVFRGSIDPALFNGRHVVGQWAWELEEFPDTWRSSFDLVDEIWAVSEFTRNAIAAATDKPVFAVPHAIVTPPVPTGVGRVELGLPEDRFIFLFCFDLLSVLERKNPLGLIEAFCQAFSPDDGALLVIKVINGDQRVVELEKVRMAAVDRADVLVLDDYLATGEMAALMDVADCYVSLHRSEGFGLTMAESMALGKPVIATGYSGNLDFMDDDTAYLVKWMPGSVPIGCAPYRAGARWAEPDLEDAARLMRHVVEHPDEARATGARARAAVLAGHSPRARSAFLKRRLADIEVQRADAVARATAARDAARPSALRAVLRRVLRSAIVTRYVRALARRIQDPDQES